jgi:hypothetical protein
VLYDDMLNFVVMNVGHYLIIMYRYIYVTYPNPDLGVTTRQYTTLA